MDDNCTCSKSWGHSPSSEHQPGCDVYPGKPDVSASQLDRLKYVNELLTRAENGLSDDEPDAWGALHTASAEVRAMLKQQSALV